MSVEFRLPDLGEGIHEAEIISVKVKEGDQVVEDQPIFEVETDKAVVEIPCPYTGKVEKVLVEAGQQVKVGIVMITFDLGGGAASSSSSSAASTSAKKETEAAASGSSSGRTATAAPPSAQHAADNGRVQAQGNRSSSKVVPATPATRRLARELGVDLHAIAPSGPHGRVMKEDVRAAAAGTLESRVKQAPAQAGSKSAQPAASQAVSLKDKYGDSSAAPQPLNADRGAMGGGSPAELPDFSKFGTIERVPLKSIRRKIAQNMTQSWTHIPHVTHFDEADVTDLVNMIKAHEKRAAKTDQQAPRLTLTVFALKALAQALKKYPQFNASLDEARGEIVFKHYVNIGVAVATERGLIVPVIKDVDKKNFAELSSELAEIAQKTRSGKIELERLQGGTFTLTNIGAIGGTSMSPMINFPEAAILGMARAAEKPIVKDGKVDIGVILPMALSFDHRLADGAEAAYFVQHVVNKLSDPLNFLLEG